MGDGRLHYGTPCHGAHVSGRGRHSPGDLVKHGKGRASRIDMRSPYFLPLTFRAEKIVRMEGVLDEAEALEAAGLSE